LPGGYAVTIPGNLSYNHFHSITRRIDQWGRWIDRQTRQVSVQMHFYSLETHSVAHFEINARFGPTGYNVVDVTCAALDFHGFHLHELLPEVVLTLWLIIRLYSITKPFFCFKPKPGDEPVRCLITLELATQLITTYFGLAGCVFRALYALDQSKYLTYFEAGSAWPLPYMPELGATIDLLASSKDAFTWGVLSSLLSLTLYYSVRCPSRTPLRPHRLLFVLFLALRRGCTLHVHVRRLSASPCTSCV
jgi:hypothetical protein